MAENLRAEECEPRTCSNCRFFDVVLIHETAGLGTGEPGTICRRFPPSDGAWSDVLADDWCGEWSDGDA